MQTDQVTSQPEQGTAINWNAINHRLETAREALAQGAASSAAPAEQRAILQARARALAQEPARVAAAQEFLGIVEFSLASETYALESAFVREVLPLRDFTPLPGAPSFVLGIFSARGQILSIVDLRRFFNLPEKGLGQLNTVIILRNEQMEFGILADATLGARPIALDTIQAAPPTITGIGAVYLRGVTAERVIILDAEKILSDEQIIVHQEAE